MMRRTWKKWVSMLWLAVAAATGFAAAPYLQVNGVNGDYATFHYYIDESAGQTDSVTVEFWPNEGNVQTVELWSNLNKRDRATLTPPDPNTIVAGDGNQYFCAYTMQNAGNGKWTLNLPIQKTGAYRVTCRYRLNGSSTWKWGGMRDASVVVSDNSVRDLIIYEVQVNAVDATGDGYGQRSTFNDLHDNSRFNLDYLKAVGANTLWLMPFHPIGSRLDGNHGELGSPYSIKNMWKVGEHLGDNSTRDGAMQEFKAFMSAAEAKGVNVMFDTIFNHTAKDAEIERDPALPIFLAANPLEQMRNVRPGWYSRYTGSGACFWNSDTGGSPPYEYWATATHPGQVGPAPADRHDFGKWCDTIDLYWGSYSALGNPQSEVDGMWGASSDVRQMTEYYAYFFQYWLEQTDYSIDGFRCDFAQGLPPQAWEYLVNKAKSLKPELAFMAESLDGGAVSKRAGRQFDIINDSWVWGMLNGSPNVTAIRSEIDSRKAAYGFAGVMRGLINHDQSAPANKWWTLSRYSIGAALDGAPQMFMGQELGYSDHFGFSKWRFEYDRWIPNIRDLYSMQTLWNDAAPDKDALWNRYKEVNLGRQRAPVLRLANQWYLDQVNGWGTHQRIFSTLRYEKYGWDVKDQEVVLCFVNLDPGTANSGTFQMNVPAIYLNPATRYNLRNLASSKPNDYLWPTAKTGSEIVSQGLFVAFPANLYQEGSVAQFLKLEAEGPRGPQTGYTAMTVAGTFNGWNAALNNLNLVSDFTWSGELIINNASAVRLKFTANGAWASNWGESNQSDKDLPVTGQNAESGSGDILLNGTLNGTYRFTFNEQTRAYSIERIGGPVDTDNDGLPDDWELQYFGNLGQDGEGDPDGDGKRNMTEYLAGWNPTIPNRLSDYGRVSAVGTFNGWNLGLTNLALISDYTWQGTVRVTNASAVRFKLVANGAWTVNWGESNQTDKDLPIAGQNAETGNQPDILINGTLSGDYRVTFNEQTRAYSVEALVVDTDADGLPDDWEVQYFGNLSQGAGGDPDNDGKTNLQEFQNGTNPTVVNYASLYSAMTVAGTFNGWNAALNNMRLVGDNLWEADLTLTNATGVRFKFTANSGWAVNFGVSGQTEFTPDLSGVCAAANNAGDILVQSVMTGTYRFRYHELSRVYSVQKVGGGFTSAYGTIAVVGTFNGWNASSSSLQLVADAQWRGVVTFASAAAVRYKFIANGGWSTNWGEQNQSEFGSTQGGTAELGNFGDILVTPTLNGVYTFSFNEATRRYTLQPSL